MQFLNLSLPTHYFCILFKSYQMRQYNYQKVNKHASLGKQLSMLFYSVVQKQPKFARTVIFPLYIDGRLLIVYWL